MSITNSSSARRAGFKVNDEAIEDGAAISMAKFGVRTLYIPLPTTVFTLSGTSVAIAIDGVFNVITMPDANVGNIYTSRRLPAEWDSGAIVLTIFWKSTAITGNAKFSASISSKATGGTTALEVTQTVTTAANTTASKLTVSQVSFVAGTFTAGDLLGLLISRDPTDVADTLGADLSIVGAVLEYTGRG